MTMPFWLSRSTYMTASMSTRSSRPSRADISSTTTAIECGSSARPPTRAASAKGAAHTDERWLANELRDHHSFVFVGQLTVGIERRAFRQARDEHISEHVDLKA